MASSAPLSTLTGWLDGDRTEADCLSLSAIEASLCRAWARIRFNRVIKNLVEKWPSFKPIPLAEGVRMECNYPPPTNQKYVLRLVFVPINQGKSQADFRNHGAIVIEFESNEGTTEEVEELLTLRVECSKLKELILKKEKIVLMGTSNKRSYVNHLQTFLDFVGFPIDVLFPLLLECLAPIKELSISSSPTHLYHSKYFTDKSLFPSSAKVPRAIWDLAMTFATKRGGLHSLNLQTVEAPSSEDEEAGANLEDESEGDQSEDDESEGSLADFIEHGPVADGTEGDEDEGEGEGDAAVAGGRDREAEEEERGTEGGDEGEDEGPSASERADFQAVGEDEGEVPIEALNEEAEGAEGAEEGGEEPPAKRRTSKRRKAPKPNVRQIIEAATEAEEVSPTKRKKKNQAMFDEEEESKAEEPVEVPPKKKQKQGLGQESSKELKAEGEPKGLKQEPEEESKKVPQEAKAEAVKAEAIRAEAVKAEPPPKRAAVSDLATLLADDLLEQEAEEANAAAAEASGAGATATAAEDASETAQAKKKKKKKKKSVATPATAEVPAPVASPAGSHKKRKKRKAPPAGQQ